MITRYKEIILTKSKIVLKNWFVRVAVPVSLVFVVVVKFVFYSEYNIAYSNNQSGGTTIGKVDTLVIDEKKQREIDPGFVEYFNANKYLLSSDKIVTITYVLYDDEVQSFLKKVVNFLNSNGYQVKYNSIGSMNIAMQHYKYFYILNNGIFIDRKK